MHDSAIRPPVQMASRPALRIGGALSGLCPDGGAARARNRPVTVPAKETEHGLAMWHTTLRIAAVVMGVAFAYAVLRYVVLGTVQAVHVPLYIVNKAAAFTSLTLVAMALAMTPAVALFPRKAATWNPLRKGLGVVGFGLGAVHGFVTTTLMNPSYYKKFYLASGQLSLQGELLMLLGIVALGLLVPVAVTSIGAVKNAMSPGAWKSIQRLSVYAFHAAGLHVVVMGVKTWITPGTWPKGLPPITLLAAVVVAVALLLRRFVRAR